MTWKTVQDEESSMRIEGPFVHEMYLSRTTAHTRAKIITVISRRTYGHLHHRGSLLARRINIGQQAQCPQFVRGCYHCWGWSLVSARGASFIPSERCR